MSKQEIFPGKLGFISKSKLLAGLNGLLIFLALMANPSHAADLAADKRVGAGYSSSFFVDPAGNLWAWGGRQGPNPKQVMIDVQSISIGEDFSTIFVIRKDGSLWGWGDSKHGELGLISKDRIEEPIQVLPSVRSIAAESRIVFAIKPDNSLWAWGNWRISRGDNIRKNLTKPRKVLNKVKLVSASYTHTLALRENGSLWSWGYNQCGGLGDGTWEEGYRPRKVNLKNLKGSKIVSIATSSGKSYAVTEDGLAWEWGELSHGRPGCIDPVYLLIPTRIKELDNVQEIATGGDQVIVLKKDGSVWELGGTAYVLSDAVEIAVGQYHAIVLKRGKNDRREDKWGKNDRREDKKDGTVWTWGENTYGQIGDGTTNHTVEPKQVIFPK